MPTRCSARIRVRRHCVSLDSSTSCSSALGRFVSIHVGRRLLRPYAVSCRRCHPRRVLGAGGAHAPVGPHALHSPAVRRTGVTFRNQLTETRDFNVFTYAFL